VLEKNASARAPSSRASLSRGARLGAYEIETLLGSGGMGDVYRARDTRLDRTVAIKVLPAHVAEDRARRRRFETEARAISQISHPHICALYDVGEAPRAALVDDDRSAQDSIPGTVPFLVMEYLDGETLADRLSRKPLPLLETLQYATQVAQALDAAHRRGIIHGDLKPANIMLTRVGVKLLDFGLARLATSQFTDTASDSQPNTETVTIEAVIRGTVPYMAPELLVGGKADVRSDVFAFGAVLYEMLAGRRAFVGDSESAIVAAILESQPAPLEAQHATVPPALTHLVTTCLAKDPDERWQSAGDLKRQLAWISEDTSVPAHAIRTGKAEGKRLSLWRAAAVLFLLTSLALIGVMAFSGRPPASARVRFQIHPPANTTFADLMFRLSPDGRQLAYVAMAPDGTRGIWVHSLETGEARRLASGGQVVWSPDSRFLAFSADGKIKKVASDGSSLRTLVDALGGANDWSRDDVLLFIMESGVVKRMPASGGTVTTLTALDATRQEIAHYFPRLLPDDRYFVYLRKSLAAETSGVYIGSIDARPEEQDLTRLVANAAMAVYAPGPEDPRIGHLLFNRGETLLAQRFDAGALRLEGDEFPVAERVAVQGNPSQAAFFSASDNGVLAYREAERRAGTPVWVNRAGVELAALAQSPLPGLEQVRLSPDGARVALVVQGEIWVYDLGGRPPIRLTSGDDLGDMPFWSSDGHEIIYSKTQSPIQLFSVPVEVGSTPTPVSPLGHYHAHGWSPDRRDLITVLNSYSPSGWDILKIPWRRNGAPEPFVATSSDDGMHGAALSLDGRWLAYTLNATGNHEVWVRPYAGSAPPVRVSANGGVDPQWARDGSELYFLENLKRMMVVGVKPGTTFNFTPPRLLFELPFPTTSVFPNLSYDVAADGKFVMVRPAPPPASPTPITVVLNWASGLTN